MSIYSEFLVVSMVNTAPESPTKLVTLIASRSADPLEYEETQPKLSPRFDRRNMMHADAIRLAPVHLGGF